MVRKRKKQKRKDWYEEDWALPVLIVFGAGLIKVVMNMRDEAKAREQLVREAVYRVPSSMTAPVTPDQPAVEPAPSYPVIQGRPVSPVLSIAPKIIEITPEMHGGSFPKCVKGVQFKLTPCPPGTDRACTLMARDPCPEGYGSYPLEQCSACNPPPPPITERRTVTEVERENLQQCVPEHVQILLPDCPYGMGRKREKFVKTSCPKGTRQSSAWGQSACMPIRETMHQVRPA